MKFIIHIFKVLHIKIKCLKYGIKNYVINDDYTIDVNDSVMILGKFKKFPLNFRNINGSFTCSNNGLISLKGCPNIIDGFFNISWNNILNFDYFPARINGNFTCSYNPLRNFKGIGKCYISNGITCRGAVIESLEGIPENYNGIPDFGIYNLPQEILSNRNYMEYIIKEQNIYGIWNSDGSLNKGRFDIMMREIKEIHKKGYIDNVAQWDLINIGGYTHYE